jgi:hypothetical protein
MSQTDGAEPSSHHLTLRTFGGRNSQGHPVMVASCLCSWQHMTAYSPFNRAMTGWRRARRYLRSRYDDHLPPSGFGPATKGSDHA